MKKIYLLFLISLFNLYFTQTYFHNTQGNIDVTVGGQLQYTLPIALPPGIKSVAPQINLVYTSGNGNSIAGYGWSLSGITNISRTGKTLEKDSEVSGVNFGSGPYQFNGQRLMYKSGGNGPPYGGAAGSIYTTENYSNVVIKALGSITGQTWQGPEYWEVTFEDGSQAWYGATTTGSSNARTPVEYNIVKWKDAQGNYISYNYTQTNNVATISSIQWGGNESIGKAHFNTVTFNYINRDIKETSYLNGIEFVRDQLLNDIVVTANGGQFKKYVVNYGKDIINNDTNQIVNYQFVKSIQEFNSQNEPSNPVTFTTKPLVTSTQEKNFGDFTNLITTGDYNGDGLVDFIVKQPAQNGRPEGYYLYFDAVNNANASFVYLGSNSSFDSQSIVTFNIKPNDGYIKPKQGLLLGKSLSSTYPTPATGIVELKYYSINSDASILNTTNNPLILEYSKTITATDYVFADSQYPPYSTPANYGISKLSQFESLKEVDIDSDGMSELIFGVKDSRCFKSQIPPNNWSCNDLGYRYIVIDNTDLQGSSIHRLSNVTPKNILSKGGIMDFDNDGRQDIMFIEPNVGNVNVSFYTTESTGSIVQKTLSAQSNKISQYYLISTGGSYSIALKNTFNVKGLAKYIQFADLNGDKNIEILAPLEKGDYYSTRDMGWSISLNNGKTLSESFQGLILFRDDTAFTYYSLENDYPTAFDIDNDGKSEFVMFYNAYSSYYNHSNVGIATFREFQYNPNNSQFKWSYKKYFNYNVTVGGEILYPIYGDFRVNNTNSKILLISKSTNSNNRKLISYQNYNLSIDKNISTIKQGDVLTEIDYKELSPTINPNLYASVKKEQYPYMELDRISQSYVVSQLRQAGVRKQDFRYRGLITHLRGKGIIGFRQSARSSWYADGYENAKIWSGAEMDPLNEGVPVKEWSIRTNDENLIFPADLSISNTQLLSFKQTTYRTDNISGLAYKLIKAIVPIQSITKDFLKNVITENTITYGEYYLPSFTETKINGNVAIKTSELHYINNSGGTGQNYYIGRPDWKLETISTYGDTKHAKEVYTYTNNLLETLTKYDNADIGWVKEKYYYDEGSSQGFGNITKKEITNSEDSKIVTSQAQYDSKGRFVIKKTDNLGLETELTYNDLGQVFTEKDPIGNIITNVYDYWGKPSSSVSSLNGTTSYTYERDSYKNYITTQNNPDGSLSVNFVNVLGQRFKGIVKAFEQNKYTAQETRYDNMGRKIYDSEPYFTTSISQNYQGAGGSTITYDDTVFPTKTTVQAPNNGKKIETTITGNITTIIEKNGYGRSYTKTYDALGNLTSVTDPGGTINYKYDANSQQTEARYGDNLVSTSYDNWGRKNRFNDPANGVYEYEYDGLGKPIIETSPKGNKYYHYKPNGLLDSMNESSSDGTTNKSYSFTYNQYGQLTGKSGNSNGKTYSKLYGYHPDGRLWGTTEYIENKQFRDWDMIYDSYGNVKTYTKEILSNGMTTSVKIENFHNTWDGSLYQVKEQGTGKVLWEIQSTNAKGQVVTAKLGAAQITNIYDSFGFLGNERHYANNQSSQRIMEVSYRFDGIKNELTERHHIDFSLDEFFSYDNNNRLLGWTNPKTGLLSSNIYDEKGRITLNDQIGNVSYETIGNVYRATKINLNANGTANYGIGGQNILLQNISYNENNDPVKIRGRQNDYAFEYGLSENRQVMHYGGKFENSQNAQFTKIYSEDGSFQITKNNSSELEEHIIYIGGNPYDSNIIYKKEYTSNITRLLFLHKDYLGSILAVTDPSGYAIERRHYDAWGNFTNLKIAGSITNPDTYTGNLLIDRGYTSHEWLKGVGLIHMNGRLYDPLLRRFLNADENIQDPMNTQNYNKYGYVMNNPLLYNDPSGEMWFTLPILGYVLLGAKAVLIGAGIAAALYVAQAGLGGSWSWSGFGKSILIGGLSGVASAGLGTVFSATGFWATVGNGALAGAGSGGIVSIINGTNFLEGVLKGAVIGGVVAGVSWTVYQTVAYYNSKSSQTITSSELEAQGYDISDQNFNDYYTTDQQIQGDFNKTTGDYQASVNNINTEFKVASSQNLPNGYSLTSTNQVWTNNPKELGNVLGITIGRNKNWWEFLTEGQKSTILIAPNLGLKSDFIKQAVFGHEYIHAYHRYIGLMGQYGKNYSNYTESSAYHFTINFLKTRGQDFGGFLNKFYTYGGNFPGQFNWTYAIKNIVNFKK